MFLSEKFILKYSTYLILWWKIGSTVNGFESWCQKNRHRPPPASCGGLHKTHVDFVHGCMTFQPQNFQPWTFQPQTHHLEFIVGKWAKTLSVENNIFYKNIFYFEVLWAPLEFLLPIAKKSAKTLVWPGKLKNRKFLKQIILVSNLPKNERKSFILVTWDTRIFNF